MKSLLSLCAGVILSTMVYSLCNAGNNECLNDLPDTPILGAQKCVHPVDSSSILIGYELRSRDTLVVAHSDSIGNLDLGYTIFYRMRPNTTFYCTSRIRYCYKTSNPENRCDKSKAGTFLVSIIPCEELEDSIKRVNIK